MYIFVYHSCRIASVNQHHAKNFSQKGMFHLIRIQILEHAIFSALFIAIVNSNIQ